MAFPNCSLEPDRVFLGVGYDTAQRRFYVPEDKLRRLKAILRDAIEYVRSGTTGQSVHTPDVPPDSGN